jgi:hypothetical protein
MLLRIASPSIPELGFEYGDLPALFLKLDLAYGPKLLWKIVCLLGLGCWRF